MDFLDYKNKHENEECFILGNSPGLSKENLSLIKNKKIFICNKGYKAIDLGLPHFNYYVISDYTVFNKIKNDIKKYVDVPVFISSVLSKKFAKRLKQDYSHYVENATIYPKHKGRIIKSIPDDLSQGWVGGFTVLIDAILIAVHMGFKNIHILGMSLDYTQENNHFYNDDSREMAHKNTVPQHLDALLENILKLKNELNSRGISIINHSNDWKHYKILPYVPLAEYQNTDNTLR